MIRTVSKITYNYLTMQEIFNVGTNGLYTLSFFMHFLTRSQKKMDSLSKKFSNTKFEATPIWQSDSK